MSILIQNIESGLTRVMISGPMTQRELATFQGTLQRQLNNGENAAVLVDAREFAGWAADDEWGNLDAQLSMDPLIRRMAIVIDPQWGALAAAFTGKGLRSFPIKIFAPSEYAKALAWASET
ncbi:MAG: STAS/SEC14 domain-containing protein [Luteolibacter sp.]